MFLPYSVSSKPQAVGSSGFSLVELLVSIGVMLLVLGVVIARQQTFNSSVLLRGQAYELALAIREIQLTTVSAVNNDTSGGGDFRAVLGVHLNSNAANRQRYVSFIDDGSSSRYYHSSDTLYGPIGLLDSRFEIRQIRYHDSGIEVEGNVSITFERPNFDAVFKSSGDPIRRTGSYQIDIGVAGDSGSVCAEDVRTVEVTSAGQVSVLDC